MIERFNVVQQSDDDLPPLIVSDARGGYVTYEDHVAIVDSLKAALAYAIKQAEDGGKKS